MRLDDEVDAGLLQLVRGGLPLRHREHRAKVAHRHRVAVDLAGLTVTDFLGCEVRDDLMAIEVEVDPIRRATPFRTAEQLAIELAGRGEAMHGKRQMERRQNGVGNAHGWKTRRK